MNSVKTLSIILAVVVVILGIGIYMSMNKGSRSQETTTQDTDEVGGTQPGTQTTPSAPAGSEGQITAIPNLTAEQKAILTPPANGTPAQQKAYGDMVTAKAISTDTVSVGKNCLLNPLAIKATSGMNLTFKNNDSLPHTFSFDQTHSVTVAAGQSKALKLDFLSGGIYGFGCDAIVGPVGMVVVAQ